MNTTDLFFSILIPAHNEENYIEETLKHILYLDYPKDRYEVIVVENASTDNTLEKIKPFENDGIIVISPTPQGVSIARNIGIKKITLQSDWVVFLDADTILKKTFLKELNNFLKKKKNIYTIGTVSLKPLPYTKKAKRWFTFYNFIHKVGHVSFAIQLIRKDILAHTQYREDLIMGEDIEIITAAKKYGKFFFMSTDSVYTSTRRFEKIGWWKIFFQWTIISNLPTRMKKIFTYKVVR